MGTHSDGGEGGQERTQYMQDFRELKVERRKLAKRVEQGKDRKGLILEEMFREGFSARRVTWEQRPKPEEEGPGLGQEEPRQKEKSMK